jgi:hypothetical protein
MTATLQVRMVGLLGFQPVLNLMEKYESRLGHDKRAFL